MKNKYYTPSIEEFHVGFEFEYLTPSGQWLPFKCYEETPDGKIDWRALRPKNLKDCRAKHLDKGDIESLGFEYAGGSMVKNATDEFTIDYNDPRGICDKVAILYNYSSKWCLVTQGGYETPYRDWTTRFAGHIKNKSELKQIFKMLGVDYGK